jgi:hypothetical protein
LLCCFTGGLFLCLTPFLWGKVRDPSSCSLLSACCDGLLTVFQCCSVIWLWILLTGSGDELCGLLSALFQVAVYHLPTVSPSAFPVFVYWKFTWRSAPCPPRSSSALRAPRPLCCMSFSVPCLLFSFFFLFAERGSAYLGAMLVYPRGGCGNTVCRLFAHLLVCISQAGLEPASGSMGALLFSQCNVAWEALYWLGVQGIGVLLLLGGFFSAKCGSSISAKFLIYRAHAVSFCPLVTILDPSVMFSE